MEAYGKMVPSVTERGPQWHTEENNTGREGQAAPSKAIGLLWLPTCQTETWGCPVPAQKPVDFMVSLPRSKSCPAWPSCQQLSHHGLVCVDPRGGGLCPCWYLWGRVF